MNTRDGRWPAMLMGIVLMIGGRLQAELPWQIIDCEDSEVVESSGLALGSDGWLWTHNDSGDGPRLFAMDRKGGPQAILTIRDADAIDWEDLAIYTSDGQKWILAADCGDNSGKRSQIQLYRFREPSMAAQSGLNRQSVTSDRLNVRFEDGPRDCEAVAVDVEAGQILLIAKTKFPWCGIYQIPLTEFEVSAKSTQPHYAVARRVSHLALPMVTAMDIDPKTGDVLVCSYFQAFVYRGTTGESFVGRMSRPPIAIDLPPLRQIEGACFDPAGNIWVSSEGQPMRMAMLPAKAWR